MLTVYGINNCDTVRKTRKWLEEQHLAYQFHDFRKQGLDSTLIQTLVNNFDPQTLINRRGTTWRQLDEQQRNCNGDALLSLLQLHPALIKRPVIHTGECWLIGFNKETQQVLTGQQT